jgi:hypothetical protein
MMSVAAVANPNSIATQLDRHKSTSKAAKLSHSIKLGVDMSADSHSPRNAKKRSADTSGPDTPAKRRRSESARDDGSNQASSKIGLGISGADNIAIAAANQGTEYVSLRGQN